MIIRSSKPEKTDFEGHNLGKELLEGAVAAPHAQQLAREVLLRHVRHHLREFRLELLSVSVSISVSLSVTVAVSV